MHTTLPSFPLWGAFTKRPQTVFSTLSQTFIAFLTPALPFITKLSNPSLLVFGLVPPVLTDPAVVPPSPSKRALKKVVRKEKQGPKLGQHDAFACLSGTARYHCPTTPRGGGGRTTGNSPTSVPPVFLLHHPQDVHDCPEPGPLVVHGWTLSHGWSKGKWQGKHCRTLHARVRLR